MTERKDDRSRKENITICRSSIKLSNSISMDDDDGLLISQEYDGMIVGTITFDEVDVDIVLVMGSKVFGSLPILLLLYPINR